MSSPQGNNDELCILRTVLDVIRDDGDIAEVESGVNLIHEIQRGRLDAFVNINRHLSVRKM